MSEPRTVRRTFTVLVLIGFIARLSYGMARTPLLALFAKSLGASSAAIGLAVGMSTVTGIFKAPAGTLSDVSGGGLAQQFGREALSLASDRKRLLSSSSAVPTTRE